MPHFRYIFPLLFCCQLLTAQMPAFKAKAAKELRNVDLITMCQDSRGLLWLGAKNGLFRFDGLRIQKITSEDSLLKSPIHCLYEYKGDMWVGYENGAIARVPINSSFLPALTGDASEQKRNAPLLNLWKIEEGLPAKQINGFACDKHDGFWFATYGEGLYTYTNGHLYQFNVADDGLSSDDIYAIAADRQGRIWAATDNGISICSISSSGKKSVLKLGKEDGLPDEIIRVLLPDAEGKMWIGTDEKGICAYDPEGKTCKNYPQNWPFGRVVDMRMFGGHELWVATESNGILRMDLLTSQIESLPSSSPQALQKVSTLYKDREGLLWAISEKGNLFNANVRFGMLNAAPTHVQALLSDHQNRLWIGAQDGLYIREGESIRKLLQNPQNVLSLWESPTHHKIWVGTFGDGVFILDDQGKVLQHIAERDGLPNGSILSIGGFADKVWLATLGGVTVADCPGAGMPVSWKKQDELGSSYVYKVFADHSGKIWFGTDGRGLATLDAQGIHFQNEFNGKTIKTVYSIVQDQKGRIWFSTEKDGLFCLDGQKVQGYQPEDLLHSLRISGLASDANGQIIIGYEDGFDVLTPDRLNHFMFCDESIGVPNVIVNLNALCTDASGNVWIGTERGVMRSAAFQEKFIDDPVPGFSAISIFLESIDYESVNVFPYDKNYFIFNFMGLWLTNPEAVRYRYRLEGFDPDWKLSKDHLASYPNLAPGTYSFRMQTSEHGNFDHAPEIQWTFTIEPPFWKRWWFVVLSLSGISLILYWFMNNREKRLNREAQLEREKVASQFETLKSQINPHFLFNSFNTLITIIEENPKMAVEYLEHLSDFYRNIMVYRERDFISIQEERELVRSFDFLLKKRYESGFFLEDRLNGLQGLIMPLALQMLVENAVKHNVISASRPLLIEIYSENKEYIVVRNNIQRKIKPEPSTHFGLQSLINRYALMGEKPVIVENDDHFFIVKVPIKH